MKLSRRQVVAGGALLLSSPLASRGLSAQSGPIKIGGTLALTGPLAATGVIHKVAGETYVDLLNKRGGLLGRQVEWVLKDDQSQADLTRTLYEQLVTVDKVDLIIGPYATAGILASIGVAQRYGKMIIHNTLGTPALAKYDMQFQAGGVSADPENTWPARLFDAVATAPKVPKSVAYVTSKFPSVQFVSNGARAVGKSHGMTEALYLEYEFGSRDFGPIAARVKDAKPDLLWMGALGVDGSLLLEAMRKIDYVPPMHFYMFPAPGPMIKNPDGNLAMALTTFEEHPPFTTGAFAEAYVPAYHDHATKQGLPDIAVDYQAAVAAASWQVLEASAVATKGLDDKAMAGWLRQNAVDTIIGKQRWGGPYNYITGSDLYKVKQLQNGVWKVVSPQEFAAPGAKLMVR